MFRVYRAEEPDLWGLGLALAPGPQAGSCSPQNKQAKPRHIAAGHQVSLPLISGLGLWVVVLISRVFIDFDRSHRGRTFWTNGGASSSRDLVRWDVLAG
jgi:hypothetical protein